MFVLGHELGHIEHGDHKRAYIINEASSIIFQNNFTNFLAKFTELYYDREMETAADLFAMEWMLSKGANPNGAISLLEILQKESLVEGNSEKVLSYISSHPATSQRIELIKLQMKNDKRGKEGIISAKSWQAIKAICLVSQ